jgi:hypothetical protein
VRSRDGRATAAEVRNARGNPTTPLTRAEVESKFRRNVGDFLEPALVDGAVAALLDPEGVDTDSLAVLSRSLLTHLPGG